MELRVSKVALAVGIRFTTTVDPHYFRAPYMRKSIAYKR